MAYPAISVANSILKLAKQKGIKDINPMKLQKLLYLSQFWYLKNFDDILIDDNFSRWKYGPVIPSIYYDLKHYGDNHIDSYIRRLHPNDDVLIYMMRDEDSRSCELLKEVLAVYGKYDGFQLSALTHQHGSAWAAKIPDTVITRQDMETSENL